MKRNSTYKSTPNDLASISLTSNLNNQLAPSSNNLTNNCSLQSSVQKLKQQQPKSVTSVDSLSVIDSNATLSTGNKFSFSKTPSNSTSSSNSNNQAHICLSMPLAKPSLNELKPQLSIESKMKTKSLIERRGSNNSLTLSLNTNKKKLQIINPSKECTTVEYLANQSSLMTINELIEISKNTNNIYNEFYLLPFNHSESCVPSSGIKNRYKTIVPNESTRVNLPILNNDPLSSYINANYIGGYKCEPKAYIAAQGPMSNTINDFWRMIWNDRIRCTVMITKLVERNKNKCELYFPEELAVPVEFNNITVTVIHINYFQDYERRQLKVVHKGETRFVHHYWYKGWPDHNLPKNPNSLLDLIKLVESDRKFDDGLGKGPVLVHCSAGVGRTGCFLALSIGIKQIDLNNLVDVVKIISHLRMDRGGMIQTLEQYEFIYQVLAYYCIYYKKYPFGSNLSISSSSNIQTPTSLNCVLRSPTISTAFSFNAQ